MCTGNGFGEEGIELLRGSLEAKGHLDALGSLSADEGDEEEEEEEERKDEDGDSAQETSHTEDGRDDSMAEKMRVVSVSLPTTQYGQGRTNISLFSLLPNQHNRLMFSLNS